jgi:hypothetical protein
MPGGSLRVDVSADFDVTLTGAVEEVCRGEIAESWVRASNGIARRRRHPRRR